MIVKYWPRETERGELKFIHKRCSSATISTANYKGRVWVRNPASALDIKRHLC